MLRKKLPNSGIVVSIPPIHYILDVIDLGNLSKGVLPDIPVIETQENIILKRDLIKMAAIETVQRKQ
ncbi:MAG: hypothetical protein ACJATA_001800 [Sphingobacteriales bacterium]|jgi:hypothetical protein